MTESKWPAIIDFHCHTASEAFIPASFTEGVIDNAMASFAARGVPVRRDLVREMFQARLQDHQCDELVQEMDAAGISHAVLLLPDFTFALKDSRMVIAEAFVKHREIADRHPGRFSIFAGVDPRWGAAGVELFERGVREYGFHGLKVYPPCGFGPADPSMYPYYEICARYQLPALVHIGATSPVLGFATAHPMALDEAARAFPQVDFILAHGSVSHVDDCLMLCTYRPNVYLDVSGFQGPGPSVLAPLFARNIAHKVLFGTDWPLFRYKGTQRECVEGIFAEPALAALDEDAATAFFSDNARRILGRRRLPGVGEVGGPSSEPRREGFPSSTLGTCS